jgi:hypothetical protein
LIFKAAGMSVQLFTVPSLVSFPQFQINPGTPLTGLLQGKFPSCIYHLNIQKRESYEQFYITRDLAIF